MQKSTKNRLQSDLRRIDHGVRLDCGHNLLRRYSAGYDAAVEMGYGNTLDVELYTDLLSYDNARRCARFVVLPVQQ